MPYYINSNNAIRFLINVFEETFLKNPFNIHLMLYVHISALCWIE